MKVAYITSRFPHLPETFILREMIALEKVGTRVELFPLIVQKQRVMHEDASVWLPRVHKTPLVSISSLAALIRTASCQPGNLFNIFFEVVKGNWKNRKFFLRALVIFPKAVHMAGMMKDLQINHVHAHYATHPALAAWIIYRLTGISYSVSVHAHDIFVDQTMMCEKFQSSRFVRAISDYNRSFLIAHCGDSIQEKIKIIHCGIRVDQYHWDRKNNSPFKVLSVGSLQPYKGQEYLIQACGWLKRKNIDFLCLIVGDGELYGFLRKKIVDLDLLDDVILLGSKNEQEVVRLMAGSHCYVQPSVITQTGKKEGIPVAIMEALASRLPVVATNISGIPEIIQDRCTGFLVPSEDAVALAERIFWVYQNPDESKMIARAGRKKVVRDFNIDRVAIQLNDTFESIVGR